MPDSSNTTGVGNISVINGAGNPCYNIPALTSCTFPVTIGANANPGSFTVIATVPSSGSSLVSTAKPGFFSKVFNSIKSAVGIRSGQTFNLRANIGVINLPANTEAGANGITFLFNNPITGSATSPTTVAVTAVVGSNAGAFNTLNLTNGSLLNFSCISGNSGSGKSNLAAGAVVTCNIVIPAGVSSQVFYAQLMENGTPVGAVATNSNTIVLTNPALATGILNVQPSQFNLTDSYESQILTYTNTGNGPISALNISPASPLINGSTTCGSTLESGASCTYAVSFDGSQAIAGSSNVTASYNNGQTSTTAVSSLSYVGTNPESGLTITGTNSLIFTAKTATPSESTQITLTNIGNTNESNISFTIPTYFSLSAGSNNSCSLSGNAITDILTPANGIHNNCTLTRLLHKPSKK